MHSALLLDNQGEQSGLGEGIEELLAERSLVARKQAFANSLPVLLMGALGRAIRIRLAQAAASTWRTGLQQGKPPLAEQHFAKNRSASTPTAA
jgi:hypothetical protein